MTTELTLQVPLSLLISLERKAMGQGVSLEALCLSLLSDNQLEAEATTFVDPQFYPHLNLIDMRSELQKVIESSLPTEEIQRRVRKLEFQISRRYIK